jgi:hypothetical protein
MTQPYQQQAPQEVVFYQDASPVYISSSRAIFFGQTFILRNIASVSLERTPRKHTSEIVLLVIGIILFYVGIQFGTKYAVEGTIIVIYGAFFLLVGVALIVLSIYQFLKLKPLYALVIGSPGGTVKTVISENTEYLTMLMNTLNYALTSRV